MSPNKILTYIKFLFFLDVIPELFLGFFIILTIYIRFCYWLKINVSFLDIYFLIFCFSSPISFSITWVIFFENNDNKLYVDNNYERNKQFYRSVFSFDWWLTWYLNFTMPIIIYVFSIQLFNITGYAIVFDWYMICFLLTAFCNIIWFIFFKKINRSYKFYYYTYLFIYLLLCFFSYLLRYAF